MTIDLSRIGNELALFADLGTDPPQVSADGDRLIVRMVREGERLEILFHEGSDKVTERWLDGDQIRTHASYRSLLAAEGFGSLRRWTSQQRRSLRHLKSAYDRRIPVTGVLSNEGMPLDVHRFDEFLVAQKRAHEHSVQVMLIDGPAGIGKTRFIEFLAWARTNRFLTMQDPLILHVQSRGRVLTYLQDLIAFSLQRLRLTVTFDQIPVLVRHGLVILAIDGFDELADPNGYELAWSQVSELVDQVRGDGTLILAGRETFVGHERIRRSIQALKQHDEVRALTLQAPSPVIAKQWLQASRSGILESVEALFEPGSLALRPFFLARLADLPPTVQLGRPQAGVLLASLVDSMIEREAGKFGDAVDTIMNEQQRRDYVRHFLREVARFMADDQTEAIDELMLSWLAEMVAPDELDTETLALLKNRTSVIAFLENDDTPRYRRFSHCTLFNHFLSEELLDSVRRRELPKCVRRNLFGAGFLATFSDLSCHVSHSDPDRVQAFFEAALELAQTYLWTDRGVRNLGALLITVLPSMQGNDTLILRRIDVDEALIRGRVPSATLDEVVVNQLDIQSANLESLIFSDSRIGTLTIDDATLVPASIPLPERLQYREINAATGTVIFDRSEIGNLLSKHGRSSTHEEHQPAR